MSHRFMYQNRLSSAVIITPRSMAQGVVGGAVPRVANGSGGVIFTGPYTGDGQRIYTVEIDGAGDVSVATFKWRTTDTAAGSWEASGVLTALTDITLSDGVKARFTAGAGTDFSLGDRWEATASNRFGKRFLYDLDPNQRFRTGTPSDPEFVACDLLTAQEVKAAVVHLHNVSSGATVKFQGGPVEQKSAITLDGTGGRVTTGATVLDAVTECSVAFWMYPTAWGVNYRGALGNPSNASGVLFNSGGRLLWGTGSFTDGVDSISNVNIGDAAALNAWAHIVCTWKAGVGFKVYKNGSLVTSGASAIATFTWPAFALGIWNGVANYFAGRLDEARVYNRELTTGDVTNLYTGVDVPAGLVAHYKLDEGSGTSAADSSGSGFTGTLAGGAAWTTNVHSPVDETVTYRAGTMFRYLASASKTWRYWRLLITGDSGNPDGWIEIGELYLGDYFEPSEDFRWNSVPAGEEAVERRQETESGTPRDVLLNRLRSARLGYEHLAAAQVASFRAMFQAVKDAANGRNLPLFAHLDVDDGGESLKLYRLGASLAPIVEGPDDHALEIELLERGT